MNINELLKKQEELQSLFGFPIDSVDEKVKAGLIYSYCVGAIKEISEVMDEFSWKPWALDTFINRKEVVSETVDTLFFLLNIFVTLDVDESELQAAINKKYDKNIRRALSGYTHKTNKCKKCGRAIDDYFDIEDIEINHRVLCEICEKS